MPMQLSPTKDGIDSSLFSDTILLSRVRGCALIFNLSVNCHSSSGNKLQNIFYYIWNMLATLDVGIRMPGVAAGEKRREILLGSLELPMACALKCAVFNAPVEGEIS